MNYNEYTFKLYMKYFSIYLYVKHSSIVKGCNLKRLIKFIFLKYKAFYFLIIWQNF